MVARIVILTAVLGCFVSYASFASAQQVNRVQPIILEASPSCCANPAATATASELVCLPCGDSTYLPPKDRDPLRVVPVASQMKPLPVAQSMRGYEMVTPCSLSGACAAPITPIPPAAPPAPPVTTTLLRPTAYPTNYATASCTSCAVPVQTVPDGYVLGKGSLGQPTLYKPGQPVRNFFRFITL